MPSRSVAVWLRISTTDQKFDAQLYVVERYIEARYIEERGWSVVARFLEEG